ncbi:MAG TPA: hypothetical protein VMF11_04100 [Candidatus Baltobacteraceae bacterium]|nr:hypothetical protein [Candidatus Baltobacteraceae bacterium]
MKIRALAAAIGAITVMFLPRPASAVIEKILLFNSSDRCAVFLVSSTPGVSGMELQTRRIVSGGEASITPQAKYGPTSGALRITVEASVYRSVQDCTRAANGTTGLYFTKVSGVANRIPSSKPVTWHVRLTGGNGHYRIYM